MANSDAITLEYWKPIPNYEGRYEASNQGRIRNVNGHVLKPKRERYLRLEIGGKSFNVHRLIAAAFFGPCPNGYQVNHRDGNRHNNAVDNLEYCTHIENERHAATLGLKAKGSRNGFAKLNEGIIS